MSTHVLYGDSFLVPEGLRRLKAEAGVEGLLEADSHHLQGAQLKPPELFSICNALPFMDTFRLVVVEGLLATLERRQARGRRRPAESGSPTPSLLGWEELTRALPEMPETTLLVFTEGPLSEGNPLLKLLRPLSRVQALAAPTGEGLARWIKESAKNKGASISPAAIRHLTDLVGNDLWTLDRELEKLSLFAFERTIEEPDVVELVSQVREANIFGAVDAMIEGRPAVALRLLHQLRQDGREVSYIIAMVERQLRLLALARESMDKGVPHSDMGSRLGVSSQFVLRKIVDQARRQSWQDIRASYRRLLEADLAVKRGVMEPDLALELLVADQTPRR